MYKHLTEEPTFTLPAGERARLERAFSEHLQTVAPMGGVRLTAALPGGEGAPVCETTRRGVRWMPQDRTPVGGYFALPTVGKKHSTLARLLAMVFRNKKA